MPSAPVALPPLAEIIVAIKKRPADLSLDQVATDCGVSRSWLDQLISGSIEHPSYNRVKCIYEYIAKAKANA